MLFHFGFKQFHQTPSGQTSQMRLRQIKFGTNVTILEEFVLKNQYKQNCYAWFQKFDKYISGSKLQLDVYCGQSSYRSGFSTCKFVASGCTAQPVVNN